MKNLLKKLENIAVTTNWNKIGLGTKMTKTKTEINYQSYIGKCKIINKNKIKNTKVPNKITKI